MDMVIYHIDMVILDIDMGYGLMIWEMTVSIWLSPISNWDILSLCSPGGGCGGDGGGGDGDGGASARGDGEGGGGWNESRTCAHGQDVTTWGERRMSSDEERSVKVYAEAGGVSRQASALAPFT